MSDQQWPQLSQQSESFERRSQEFHEHAEAFQTPLQERKSSLAMQSQNIEQMPTAQHDPLSITEKSHLQLSADSLEGEWSGITGCFMQWLSEYDFQLDIEETTAKKAKMSEGSASGEPGLRPVQGHGFA